VFVDYALYDDLGYWFCSTCCKEPLVCCRGHSDQHNATTGLTSDLHDPSNLLYVLQRLVREHSTVKLLAEVSSRALQVQLQATRKEANKPTLIHSYTKVQSLLPCLLSAWLESCNNNIPPADKQLVAQQLQQTGGAMRGRWCLLSWYDMQHHACILLWH
jgi:hypothetical protein